MNTGATTLQTPPWWRAGEFGAHPPGPAAKGPRQRARRLAALLAALALLTGVPAAGWTQVADSLPTHTRVRVDLHGSERSLLRRPVAQPIAGTLLEWRADTLLLSVAEGTEPLRVPQATIAAIHVSRGKSGRLESAFRRAIVPTLASAALNALRASLNPGGPSPGEAALTAGARTVVVTASLGFVFPGERWRRVSLPRPRPASGARQGPGPDTVRAERPTP